MRVFENSSLLGETLSVSGQALSDDRVIRKAFQATLENGDIRHLTRLPGSFSGIITQEHQTSAFADVGGQFPIYYTDTEVSSGALELARRSGADIDTTTIAARIAGLAPLTADYSYFRGIRRLKGGERLWQTADGTYVDQYEELVPKSDRSYIEAAMQSRQAIIEAIHNRTATRLCSDFSGGLDSTSVALAAAALHDQEVNAFVYYSRKYPEGDIDYARQFAALDKRIRLHAFQTNDSHVAYTNLNDISTIPFMPDEPYKGIAVQARELTRRHMVNDQESLYLNGVGGDALYDGMPYIADFLREDELQKAEKLSVLLGRLYLVDPDALFSGAVLQSNLTLPKAYEALAETLTDPSKWSFDTGWFSELSPAVQWLSRDARQAMAERAFKVGQAARDTMTSIGDYNAKFQIWDCGEAQRHHSFLLGKDIPVQAPFLDTNVVLAATSIPARFRNRIGTFKVFLRDTMQGIVPDEIFQQRKGKGNYSSEMYAGIRRAMPQILNLLADSRLAAMGVIVPTAVRRTLTSLDISSEFPLYGLATLLSAEVWLRQHEATAASAGLDELLPAQPQKASAVVPEAGESQHTAGQSDVFSRLFTIPEHIRVVSGPSQFVLFDTHMGIHTAGNASARAMLHILNLTGDPNDVVNGLCQQFLSVPRKQLETDVASFVQGMAARGFLQESAKFQPHDIIAWQENAEATAANAAELMRVRELSPQELFPLRPVERTLGEAALARAIELQKLNFGEMLQYIAQLKSAGLREATKQEALRNLIIMHRISGSVGRVACYERSLGAVLLGAQQKINIGWALGVTFGPLRSHAWPEAEGVPIKTRADEAIEGVYTKWLSC